MEPVTYRRGRTLQENEDADILGMPLQLAILVIVAGLALASIVAWFVLLEDDTLRITKIEPEEIAAPGGDKTLDMTITVRDQNDDGVSGAVLTVSGCSATWSGTGIVKTGDGGTVQAELSVSTTQDTCEVTLKASKSGWTADSTTILVVRTSASSS